VLAIDWSSDAGINPKKPLVAPSFLGLAVVAYDDEGILQDVVNGIRCQRRLPLHYEFHFADENRHVRAAFFDTLAHAPVTAAIAVVDKHRASVSTSWTLGTGDDLLHQLMLMCIERMPREVVEEQLLLVDGNKSSKNFCTRARKLLSEGFRADGFDYRIDKVRPSESSRTPGVQVADMLAGAARYAALRGDPTYLNLVRRRIAIRLDVP
jgi:Protein of unknown function (DUF3800)